MDIQKEREAFEKHASKFFTTNEAFENDGENYVYDEVKFMWDCWLAAKTQAVPEWFVLVPRVATKQMVNAGYEAHDGFFTNGQVQDVYQAMIEAQEPAND